MYITYNYIHIYNSPKERGDFKWLTIQMHNHKNQDS